MQAERNMSQGCLDGERPAGCPFSSLLGPSWARGLGAVEYHLPPGLRAGETGGQLGDSVGLKVARRSGAALEVKY